MVQHRRWLALGGALVALAWAAPLSAAPDYGKISGHVVDPAGRPQMGATVTVATENPRSPSAPLQFFTNDRGAFTAENLLPGLYTIRVTLAGYLPTLRRHVRIDASLTTILRIEMDSIFASFDALRPKPNQKSEADDWMWVLRTSPSTRPVLRYSGGEVLLAGELSVEETGRRSPRGRVEISSGARRPGSASNIADAPSTAFAYEQRVNRSAKMVFAGQASYESNTSAGFATLWLPSGEPGAGPQTTLVLRRADLGPQNPVFRGVRADHSGQLTLGDRFVLKYGGEFILVGFGRSTSSLRPRGELDVNLPGGWTASLSVSPRPLSTSELNAPPLQAALYALDSFPAVFLRNGRPVLESGWHDEIALENLLGPNTRLVASIFRDRSSHTAVFGRGATSDAEFLQDYFSNTFAYDGGASSSWGARIVWRQKFSDDLETTFLYSWSGALTADADASADGVLRDGLHTRKAHSFSAKISARVPHAGTRVTTGYKWMSRQTVSRQDPYGEALYQLDPYWNVSIRQPLPRLFSGRVEAQADFRNLLAQGYVPVNTPDGVILLLPVARSIRGGLSFQF